MKKNLFEIKENADKKIVSIYNINDNYHMNWVTEGKEWGTVIAPEGLDVQIEREYTEEGRLQEKYIFKNKLKVDLFLLNDEVGIEVPLPDNYSSAEICMKERCHAHLWCGGETSYIRAERMSGIAPHLGLVLTKGKVTGYSIKRNIKAISNDRGTFILHPQLEHFLPGEEKELDWELFWFQNRKEFDDIIQSYRNTIQVRLKHGVYFLDEETEFQVECKIDQSSEPVIEVTGNGKPAKYICRLDATKLYLTIKEKNQVPGEICWKIRINGTVTYAKTLVISKIEELVEQRCEFLVKHQQYHNAKSALDGAFLIYDNEEKRVFYGREYDQNGGRERVAMGVILAIYLSTHHNAQMEEALEKYTRYVYRELYDEESGIVYNDVGRNNEWHRLYNYPWMAVFFMERFYLTEDMRDLHNMYRILKTYYEQGGDKFYAIGIPMLESIHLLREYDLFSAADELLCLYEAHGQKIKENGLNYPAHEVNYEQSIVAPAVSYLLQLYLITDKKEYLEAGKKQMEVLSLFNGKQPDYHLFETAIRHWDGFWFGKRRTYGDTFPHYWSALSGIAFGYMETIEPQKGYGDCCENSLRGVLSMIHEDGSATCACLYPDMVNGVRAKYEDPWANDQDWALYYYMKWGKRYNE